MSVQKIEIPSQKGSITDDELEELARQLIEGMSKEDVRELCLALLELYHLYVKPVYH